MHQDYHNPSVYEMLEEHASSFADRHTAKLDLTDEALDYAWNEAYAYVVSNFLSPKQFDKWLTNLYNEAHGIKQRMGLGRPTNVLTFAVFTSN